MKIEILLESFGARGGGRRICKWRGGGYHQEGEGLGARWGQTILLAILDVIGVDAIDGIQQLRVIVPQ